MFSKSCYLLLVDDDPDDRQLLGSQFKREHPEVMIKYARSGREAMTYLSNCPVDELPAVVLLDYMIPDMTGLEILQRITADKRYSRMVKTMWTTSRSRREMELCKGLGATEYFIKPGSNEELCHIARKLSSILERSASTRSAG